MINLQLVIEEKENVNLVNNVFNVIRHLILLRNQMPSEKVVLGQTTEKRKQPDEYVEDDTKDCKKIENINKLAEKLTKENIKYGESNT